jgi:hypothetical protein
MADAEQMIQEQWQRACKELQEAQASVNQAIVKMSRSTPPEIMLELSTAIAEQDRLRAKLDALRKHLA